MVYEVKSTISYGFQTHSMTTQSDSLIIRERLPYLAVSGGVILLDRLTKFLIDQRFGQGESLSLIADFFSLTYVRNTGVAFGVFASGDSPYRVVVLSAFAIAAAVMVSVYSFRSPIGQRVLQAGLALIFGGALGNLYDRLMYGYVVDFMEFHLGSYYWPTFNIADTAISIGVACLALEIIRDEIRSRS
jgi:signal peptidase II